MNYELIKDLSELTSFIEWLPELQIGECYYVGLFARSKYCKSIVHISSDRAQMSRFVANKKNLLLKIKQLECPVGTYQQRDVIVPQEALALYITPNPRSQFSATKKLIRRAAELYTTPLGWDISQEVMSLIQTSSSRKIYIDVDIDDIDLDTVQKILIDNDILNLNAITYLQTRGGVHLLIKVSDIAKNYEKSWYQNLHKHFKIDLFGDKMMPIPGTYQGGFVPKLIYPIS